MRKLLLASALLLACGCALLRDFAQAAFVQPTLSFKNAQLADVSLGGATVNLTYALDNPNPIGLSLAEVGYTFSVEGKQVVSGSPQKGLSIPAQGQADLTFPASVKFAELAPALETFLTRDSATYEAKGFIVIETPLGVIRLPFQKQGTFDVPKLPQVQVGTPRVTNVSFNGAQVELPLALTNRNGFALPIGGIDGALQLGGKSVGTVSTGDLGSLDAKASRTVTLPLRIRFDNALSGVAGLVGRPTTLGFQGSLRSGPVALPLNFTQTVNFQQ